MRLSRRQAIEAGLRVGGLGLLPAGWLHAQELSFESDPFTLGIASGYPEANAVVLWTRLAPSPLAPGGGMPEAAVPVDWEVGDDDNLRNLRATGRTYATPDWAHSVHVEVAGLEPGRDYWYRFRSGDAESPIGRTRTAPAAGVSLARMRMALACCQHYESGHYAAFAAIAADAVDLVVHVGDYIYENRGIQSPLAARTHDAPTAFTLEDYRLRYAIYKSDPQLQAAHISAPWMLTWDDHEVDNDYADWHSNANDEQALFLARRAAAYKAYYEHQPLPRRLVPFGAYQRLHTRRSFGDLVDLHMLDGRQYRSDQVCGDRLVSPCAELYDMERSMLGQAQESWLESGLAGSRARWNLLGQQTVFAHMDQREGPDIGYWADGWSGYPPARARLVDFLTASGSSNPIVLSGDVHGFLVNDVHARPGEANSPIAATEFVTTSISSNGPPQAQFDAWQRENANVKLARSDRRGYTRFDIAPDRLHADLIAVDDARSAESSTHVLASFDVMDGQPGAIA